MSYNHTEKDDSKANKKGKNSHAEEKSQKETSNYSIHLKLPADQYTMLLRKSNMANISIDELITNTIKKLLQ